MELGSSGPFARFEAADVGRTATVRIEVPRWSFIKRKADGRVDLVSPLPCPYNYGSVVGSVAPDGDPLDALVLGPRIEFGETVETRVWAVMGFVDDGVDDPKLVCGAAPPTVAERAGVERFFGIYAAFKRTLARAQGRSASTRRVGWLDP